MTQPEQHQPALPEPPATIHMVGIGGIGVSGLARILVARGYAVTGSDLSDSPVVDDLRRLGIQVYVGHDYRNLGEASLVVATSAAKASNPELEAARERGIPIIKRAALLGQLASTRTCLAVAGSHGKSTTAGMLAYVLSRAGVDPTFAVGAVVPQLGANAGPGEGSFFVVEADEYDYSFLTLDPDIAVVTNIEHDHPDLFPDLDAIDAAFRRFTARLRRGGSIVVSADDSGSRRLVNWLSQQVVSPEIVSVGHSPAADWRIDDSHLPAVLHGPEGCRFSLELEVPGAHNRSNAAMVFAVCSILGIDTAATLAGLRTFSGVGRRFDLKGSVQDIHVFDDYAHHPTEIEATIAAARERYPDSTVWAVFQPHTFTRTRQLLSEFATALDRADRPILVEIYPSRETDDLGVSSSSIADRMGKPALVHATPEQAAGAVASEAREGDVILLLGAGDIWKASPVLLDALRNRRQVGNQFEHDRGVSVAGVTDSSRTGADGRDD